MSGAYPLQPPVQRTASFDVQVAQELIQASFENLHREIFPKLLGHLILGLAHLQVIIFFSLYVIRFLLLQLIFIIFGVHLLFPSVFPKRVICRTTYSLVKNRNKIPPRAFSSGN